MDLDHSDEHTIQLPLHFGTCEDLPDQEEIPSIVVVQKQGERIRQKMLKFLEKFERKE